MNARTLHILLLACVTLFGFHAPVALAAAPAKSFSIHAFGSYQSYAMDDVNANMQVALASFPGSTADKDKIDSGAGFGAGLRIWPRERIFFSLEFQRLLASNFGRGTYLGSDYTVDLHVPATSVTAGLGYVLLDRGRVRTALSAGVGYYVCTGELLTRGSGFNEHDDLEGSGFGFHGMGHVLTRITGRVDAEIAGGYRFAKSTDVTGQGMRIRNSDGSLAQIDWSGVTARAGLSFRVGSREEE